MHFKSMLFVLILSVIATNNVQGIGLLKAKLGLLKAKTIAVAAPHVIAKIAVAKEVKAKTAFAIAKSIEAAKAHKAAAFAAFTAPFKVAKKTIALKVGGVVAAKGLAAAKVAHVVGSLKKPILIPFGIPIPVPVKLPVPIPYKSPIASLGAGAIGFGVGLKAGSAAGTAAGAAGLGAGAAGLGAGALGAGLGGAGLLGGTGAGLLGAGLGSAGLGSGLLGGAAGAATGTASTFLNGALATLTNPVQGFINGAQSLFQTAGSLPLPFLSTLRNGVDSQTTVEARQEPVYQFITNTGFSNYNRVQYSPNVHVDLPVTNPHTSYEVPHTSFDVRSNYGAPNH